MRQRRDLSDRRIFFYSITFSRRAVFSKENYVVGIFDHFSFWERMRLAPKINTTFFYHKLDAKYFFIRQYFQKKKKKEKIEENPSFPKKNSERLFCGDI